MFSFMHIKLNIFIPDYKKLEPYIPRGIVHRQTGISEINAEAVVVKLGRWLRGHFTEIGSAMGSCNVLTKIH